mmetsp:Transcript_24350/g.53172  ORF Transcript_24350/g.53172 Transcript_24350/m.53172 type:complete len:329 (-) Transcript_24350:239-1225(-)
MPRIHVVCQLLLLCFIALPYAALLSPPSLEKRSVLLSTGLRMEWLLQPAVHGEELNEADLLPRPPLVLIHGSFHGAWCWSEHWMHYLATTLQTPCHAISLRGTSGSPDPAGSTKIRIDEHVDDIRAFVNECISQEGLPLPVLVGHSFGGAYVLKYLEGGGPAAGAALVCAVPPSGNVPMTLRFITRWPRRAWLVTRGLAFKSATRSDADARALFFDQELPAERVSAYRERLAADSRAILDVAHFSRNVPSKASSECGIASWVGDAPPTLVLGAEEDIVVDKEGVEEMAAFLGVKAIMIPRVPHDVMLCSEWKLAADALSDWVLSLDTA